MKYLLKNTFKSIIICLVFVLLSIQNSHSANKIKVKNLRTQDYKEYIRFVVDLSQKPVYKTFALHNPERVVIDINNTDYVVNKSDFEAGRLIDSIRTGKFGNGIRIVLDINVKAKIRKDFILAPSKSKKNWRLVVDIDKKELAKEEVRAKDEIGELIAIQDVDSVLAQTYNNYNNEKSELDDLIGSFVEDETEAKVIRRPDSVRGRIALTDSGIAQPILKPNMSVVKTRQAEMGKMENITVVLKNERGGVRVAKANVNKEHWSSRAKYGNDPRDKNRRKTSLRRKYNIVIDAGHGGKDPGTIGKKRTREKHITLQYAKILRDELKKTGRYNVFLTRKGDYFITLNGRVKKARKLNADLFISIHADSSPNKRARGFSVYTLSQRASDTRTAKLAKKENKADIIGGLNLYGEYQDTINVLVDLSRREAMNSSARLAEIMIREMKRSKVRTLGSGHKYGNFAVLLAPDTASILIELGFLSNRAEEKILKTWSFKQKLVRGIVKSVDRYFR